MTFELWMLAGAIAQIVASSHSASMQRGYAGRRARAAAKWRRSRLRRRGESTGAAVVDSVPG
jgi:hypothetical protein